MLYKNNPNFFLCTLCKVQHIGKAKTPFNISLRNQREDGNNSKSIPADFHFRKSRH